MTMVKHTINTEIINGIIYQRINIKRITIRRPDTTQPAKYKIIIRRVIIMIAPVIIYDWSALIWIIIFNKIYSDFKEHKIYQTTFQKNNPKFFDTYPTVN